MARTPKRLSGPTQLTTSAVTQYTAPATTKTIVRQLHVQNGSASPVTLTVSIGADAAGTRIVDGESIPANTSKDYFGYYAIEAAEILQAKASAGSALVLTCNGDEITLG